ncbi:MAG: response regulator [Anaerolineae bacterium]|nr:response regulator [Anaerolineae bacterium]MDK1080948.1 response regulator [Anaerolineae bacterium]MDK1119126.1 response regulator [Anaerolineae bacterium]
MSTILIVDDEPSARETLTAMLDGQGYKLELAASGPEAIEIARTTHLDLVLLDVMMPVMDGFDVCRRLRSTPKLAELPILILTALDNHASLITGIESGADDFLTKPIDRQELLARVRTITRLNRYRTIMEQRESLREMAERVIIAQEEERKRISRELHDDVGQTLTTHLLGLRKLQEELSSPGEVLFKLLQTFYDQTNDIYATIHQLAQDMRPPALDALGLKLAMQTYCMEFTRRTHLPITFEAEGKLSGLPDLYNITLYRTLQEALTNVAKHAESTQAWVEISPEEDFITLTVQDDGIGFVYEKDLSKGIGLIGLRERLTLAGGNLKITSNPDKGTILTAQLPLPKDDTT